ncbi:MAG: hypothetical protein IPG66_01365 [Hydrogenophilales bacterium]|nr:hypothetical protein [Hydrogenophilales bacterium]
MRSLLLAGLRLDLRGDEASRRLAPAFARLPSPPAGVAPLDGRAIATLHLHGVSDPRRDVAWRDCAPGTYQTSDGARMVLGDNPWHAERFTARPTSRLDAWLRLSDLDHGDIASQPGKFALGSWLAHRGRPLVHAAGIAWHGRGALLLGVSGRGKSTTALACLGAGFSFLGDDLCALEASPHNDRPPTIHGIYATAKLNPDSQTWLGAADWPFLGTTSKGKRAVLLPDTALFSPSAPLAALVSLVPAGEGQPGLQSLDRADALRMLTLAAAQGHLGPVSRGQWLRTAAAVVRQVPAVEMRLTWDRDVIATTLRGLLERA